MMKFLVGIGGVCSTLVLVPRPEAITALSISRYSLLTSAVSVKSTLQQQALEGRDDLWD
jgi:hypothetical protein